MGGSILSLFNGGKPHAYLSLTQVAHPPFLSSAGDRSPLIAALFRARPASPLPVLHMYTCTDSNQWKRLADWLSSFLQCNKLEPECSQCTRAGKKCPGYRDQLSLMFRDETVKVRKKFQEVTAEAAPDSASSSTETPVATPDGTVTPPNNGRSRAKPVLEPAGPQGTALGDADDSDEPLSALSRDTDRSQTAAAMAWNTKRHGSTDSDTDSFSASRPPDALIRPPRTTLEQRGLQFYIEQYLISRPNEPDSGGVLAREYAWIFEPATSTIAAAIGLAGMANLTASNKQQLERASWQSYVLGIQQTGKSLVHAQLQDLPTLTRTIVLLALYEVVRGADGSFGSANKHVMGATALMRTFLPAMPQSLQPFRMLMQYCYSLLIPCHASGAHVPSMAFEYVSAGSRSMPADERAIPELLLVAADVVNLSSHVRRHTLIDGHPSATKLIAEAQRLDARLEAWERSAQSTPEWQYELCWTTKLPPEACFRGQYHLYGDMQTARFWNYYRWSRLLADELLLHMMERCPQSAAAALIPERKDTRADAKVENDSKADDTIQQIRERSLKVIRRVAEESLIGIATHWRHPQVTVADYEEIATPWPQYSGKGGAGSVGLPPLLFHLQAAACAPGVPDEYWKWALSVVDTVWAQLGMWQARSLGELMRAHRSALQRKQSGDDVLLLLPAERLR